MRKIKNTVKRQKKEASREARTAPPLAQRPKIQSGMCLRLKVMHRNADGLVVNRKELEFKDLIRVKKSNIVGVVETSGGVHDSKERKRRPRGRGLALLIRENINI